MFVPVFVDTITDPRLKSRDSKFFFRIRFSPPNNSQNAPFNRIFKNEDIEKYLENYFYTPVHYISLSPIVSFLLLSASLNHGPSLNASSFLTLKGIIHSPLLSLPVIFLNCQEVRRAGYKLRKREERWKDGNHRGNQGRGQECGFVGFVMSSVCLSIACHGYCLF